MKFCLFSFISFIVFTSCNTNLSPIPIVYIDSEQDVTVNHKILTGFQIHDNGQVFTVKGTVKYRGGFSIGFNKKSYAVEFNNKIAWAGLPKEDDWVFNASYIDKTFLRHKIGFDLFRSMNSQNIAPKSTYIRVVENGIDKGLFVLMQKLTPKIVGLNKNDDKALLFKEPPIFYINEFPVQDINNRFQQKHPKLKIEDKSEVMYQFRDFLFQVDEETFYSEIENWLDINNIIEWYLLVLFANAGDNINKNFYFYKTDSTTPFRVALWDFDHSFGRDGDNELNMMDMPLGLHKSILFTRLRDNPQLQFNEKLIKRWNSLRKENVISHFTINQMINQNVFPILPYIKENEKLWPYNSSDYFDDNDVYKELALFRRFTQLRIKDLDKLFCYSAE